MDSNGKQGRRNGMRNPGQVPIVTKGVPHRERRRQVTHVTQPQPRTSIPEQTKDRGMKIFPLATGQVSRKLYVLDTNVLMHDWNSLLRFKENDIYLCTMVIRELDRNKKGLEEAAWNSRRASGFIETLIHTMEERDPEWKLKDGLLLEYAEGGSSGMGRIFIQSEAEVASAARFMGVDEKLNSADDHIIGATRMLTDTRGKQYSEVRLVSKDLNMRILARTRDLLVDDYTTDLVVTNADKGIYTGMVDLPSSVFEKKRQITSPSSHGDTTVCRIPVPEGVSLYANELVTDSTHASVDWIAVEVGDDSAHIRHCKNFMSKNTILGINARNREQNFLLNLLMNTEIDLVTILGAAGTGKTLLTVVAALAQKHEGIYNGIIFTRATVPVGEDIGFLPGDESDKMGAWLGALGDNIEVIAEAMSTSNSSGTSKVMQLRDKHSRGMGVADPGVESLQSEALSSLQREFKLKAITFMRGRTFLKKFIIIDEAQNLTPKQMKTLITRAGPGTKIVCLGNLDQIDTPYLTESSSGLAVAVESFKGWPRFGHITLTRGERSPLAEYAVEVL